MGLKAATILFIFVIAFTVYSNSLGGEFSWDDEYFIVKNPYIRAPLNIKAFFTDPASAAFGELAGDVYRPLTTASFSIDYALFRLNSFGYHFVNVLFHALNAALVFLALYRVGRDFFIAACAALFFACHPVQTEVVSWISGRSSLLFLFFYLLSFYFYIRSLRPGRKILLIPSLAAFCAALFSKEMAVTLPLVIVIYDIYFAKKEALGKKAARYVPFFALAAAYIAARFLVLERFSQCSWWGANPYYTFVTMLKVLGNYLTVLAWPAKLCAYYYVPVSQSLTEREVLVSVVILSAALAAVPLLYKKNRIASFAMLWFFVTILPVCNIIPIKALMAERFLYLPSIGFCLFLAFCVKKLGDLAARSRKDSRRLVSAAIAAAILLAYSGRTMARNEEWKDGVTISESILKVSPLNPWAMTSLGSAQLSNKDYEKAVRSLKKAIALSPDYASAHNALGFCYLDMERYEEAGEELERAADLDPENVEIRNSLGVAYAELKRYDDAVKQFRAAIEKNRLFASAYFNIGMVYETRGECDKAMAEYEKAASAARERADVAVAWIRMGDVNRKMKRPDGAKACYDKALEISGGKLAEIDRVVAERVRGVAVP